MRESTVEVKFLSIADVAKVTRTCQRSIQYKVAKGELKSILWGSKRLIPISALAESLGVPESELRPNQAHDATSPALPSKDLQYVPRKEKRASPSQRRPALVRVRQQKPKP
jgi:hypothetical protein